MIPDSQEWKNFRLQIEKMYKQQKELEELYSEKNLRSLEKAKFSMRELSKKLFDDLKLHEIYTLAPNRSWFTYLSEVSEFQKYVNRYNLDRVSRLKRCTEKKRNFLRCYAYDKYQISFEKFEQLSKEIKDKVYLGTPQKQKIISEYFQREP
ncbi:unnamed protein product [Brachionus calyciflorus]|uniref:Uncharacterized protein n=1 Tax=Brachionus calyciflorus TaxID=104777 RepID=A0A813M2D8_9BILA|nr:unnamed protein product [Brachionus calyciflorus]